MKKQDKITMPFNYSIVDNKNGTFSLLQNDFFLFCGQTIEECFDAMTKVYTCMKYGKSYSKGTITWMQKKSSLNVCN